MPRIIFKCPHIKGGTKRAAAHLGNLVRYVATREGVELVTHRENYMGYIAQRVGSRGLFTSGGEPLALFRVMNEVSKLPGTVWLPIISPRREDAVQLDYNNAESWQALLTAHAPELAKAMKIPLDQFWWYAAFHDKKGKSHFQLLMEMLPPEHKARWFAGAALNSSDQAMASVISTVLSRLNVFLDSEMERMLCFDTAIDAEKFCAEKSAIFIVLPEEDNTKYAIVSLLLQNLYRELLTVADEHGGRLPHRVVFYCDELGTIPPIQSLELMFSASRSRGLMLVPIVQSITGQLQKNYGKEGSEVIVDNCQLNIFGGFAPAS